MVEDEKYMRRCIQLARCGEGNVSPNPMVGAVIVWQGRIIGEGYHRKYGEAHAEVNAIRSVQDQRLLAESTLYVSLEPCSHYGKTPPCAELIIAKKIPRVVIGCLDPFPEVSGRGVALLRAAGVEVVVDVLQKEAEALNERFIAFHTARRPYVLLKWAQSIDGFIDRKRIDRTVAPIVLSSPVTRRMVHKLRAEVDAIMVGCETAILDNPSLTVRHWSGKNPVRVLVDRHLRVNRESHLYDGSAPTWIFTEREEIPPHASVEFIQLDGTRELLEQVREVLYQRNIQTLLVEGGAVLLDAFLRSGWNEARVEVAPVRLQAGVAAPHMDVPVCDIQYRERAVIQYFKQRE